MSVSLHTTVYHWLKELKIHVSRSYLKEQLLSHPDYPSLLSITDTLNELNIENAAVQINNAQIKELPLPFLAHLNGNGGEFVVVNKIDSLKSSFSNFFDRWDGVVIAVEKTEGWANKQNSEWQKKDSNNRVSLIAALSLLTLFILFSIISSFSWLFTGLLLIATTGIFILLMIVSKDLGIENKIADQLCGANDDCNSVIHSAAGKLPFNTRWSDAGIIYFSFLLITLLIASFNNSLPGIYQVIAVMASAAIPVTIVSIYYQWRAIKKWCRLCLLTSALLWALFGLLLPVDAGILRSGFHSSLFNAIITTGFIIVITSAAWLWLKSIIKKNKEIQAENFAAKRFRRNADIFTALLEKQKKLTVMPEGLGITIGNPIAANAIIKVCNPYCGPCAKAHPIIDKLLEEYKNLKVQMIFTADDDEKDMKAKPVKHLMALYEKYNEKQMQQALDDWYMADKKDYHVFSKKYLLNGEVEKQGEKLKAMKTWCNQINIEFTPTFFINGYQLPKQYTIEEVKYFLDK